MKIALVLATFALGACAAAPSAPVALDVQGRPDATPWVAATRQFVAVAWGAGGGGTADVFLAVSRDGGFTFGAPVQVNAVQAEARLGGELPPRVVLLPRENATTPEIVVVWTARGETTEIKASRSQDGGRTFERPVTMQSPGAAGDRGWPAVALDGEGGIHAIWLDHRGLAHGRSAGTGHAAHRRAAGADGAAMAQQSGLFYASIKGAPVAERELTRGICYCCKTAFAAGRDGTLYAAWRHVYPGNLRDIAFTMSSDGGESFLPPVRVSEDRWAINGCPDDGPAIAVDARGTAHLVWPTVLGEDTPEGALFYASTRDGHRFTPRVRIPTFGGSKPAHPQIVVGAGGRIHVAWDENVNGRRVAALREMTITPDGAAAFGDVITLSSGGPGSYPVLAATDSSLVAVWTSQGDESQIRVRVLPTSTTGGH